MKTMALSQESIYDATRVIIILFLNHMQGTLTEGKGSVQLTSSLR